MDNCDQCWRELDLFCVFNYSCSQQMMLHFHTVPLRNVQRLSQLLLFFYFEISQGVYAVCAFAHKDRFTGEHKVNNQTEFEGFNNFYA